MPKKGRDKDSKSPQKKKAETSGEAMPQVWLADQVRHDVIGLSGGVG